MIYILIDMSDIKNTVKESVLPLPKTIWHKLAGKRKAITAQEYTPDEQSWDNLLLDQGGTPHYMQSSAWGESKAHSQWPVSRLVVHLNDRVLPIQVFSRTVPGLGRLHYAPEVSGITKASIPAVTTQILSQYNKGMVFKLELYQPYDDDLIEAFQKNGWLRANSVQHRDTVIVDLSGSEEDLFARLKKRARYEVRVAQRNNVRVEKVEINQDRLNLLAELMGITAKRSGAFFRKDTYTNKYWHAFARRNQGSLYFAWHDMDLLAGAYVASYGKNAWYKDGGSVRHKSNLMGPRYLQWEIMRDLQSQAVKQYDLSGIPATEDVEKSSMKGLYVFKTGFSNESVKLMPAMELPLSKRHQLWPKAEQHFLRLYSGFRKDFWY